MRYHNILSIMHSRDGLKRSFFVSSSKEASVNSIHDCSLSSESSFIFTAGAQ